MDPEEGTEPRRYLGTSRLEAFSDGVFAIAITLLVLDLSIGRSGDALDRVLDAWPFYLAYVVSSCSGSRHLPFRRWNVQRPLLRLDVPTSERTSHAVTRGRGR